MISKQVFLLGFVCLFNYYEVQAQSSVCQSDVCKEYAKIVKENIDSTIDPCDDFYKFSCGNYLRTHKLKDGQDSTDISSEYAEKNIIKLSKLLNEPTSPKENQWTKNAKNFYASCINMDRVEKYSEPYFLKFIDEEIEGWPIITGVDNPLPLLELMRIIGRYKEDIFVKVSVVTNPKDPKTNIIKLEQPSYISYEEFNSKEFYEASMSYFKTVIGFMKPKNKALPNLDKDLNEMNDLLKKIIEATLKNVEKDEDNNKEIKLGDLQKQIPSFPWTEWIIKKVFRETVGLAITEDYPVLVSDWSYMVKMQDVFSFYSKNKKRVVQNYLIGEFIFNELNPYLPEKYLLADLPSTSVVAGVKGLKPRDVYCVEKAQKLLKEETGYVWVQNYFQKSAKDDAKKISSNVLNAFLENIKASDWLDANSKSKSIDKALNIKQMIGYPDNFDNSSYVDKHYIYVLGPNNLLSNYLRIRRMKRSFEELGILKKINNENDITPSETQTNVYFEKNVMLIYAGIISLPFYDQGLPKYVDYGGIGYIIGKLYTHFFTNLGRKYDKNGKYWGDDERGIWTKKTIEKFNERAKCMIDQYNQFYVKEVDKYINGTLTLEDNIAKNGGLKVAYNAYNSTKPETEPKLPGLESYTNDQIFFMAAVQPYCSLYTKEQLSYYVSQGYYAIEEFGLEALARNSPAFRKVFKCNDKNRKYKTCSVW